MVELNRTGGPYKSVRWCGPIVGLPRDLGCATPTPLGPTHSLVLTFCLQITRFKQLIVPGNPAGGGALPNCRLSWSAATWRCIKSLWASPGCCNELCAEAAAAAATAACWTEKFCSWSTYLEAKKNWHIISITSIQSQDRHTVSRNLPRNSSWVIPGLEL